MWSLTGQFAFGQLFSPRGEKRSASLQLDRQHLFSDIKGRRSETRFFVSLSKREEVSSWIRFNEKTWFVWGGCRSCSAVCLRKLNWTKRNHLMETSILLIFFMVALQTSQLLIVSINDDKETQKHWTRFYKSRWWCLTEEDECTWFGWSICSNISTRLKTLFWRLLKAELG